MPTSELPLTGSLLIADIDLQDPSFLRAVVLVVEHGPEGALGLIINRPLGLTAAQIAHDEGQVIDHPERREKIPLYGGGPVETQAVFTLHSGLPESYRSAACREVLPGVFFEPSFPALQAYVAGRTPEFPPDDVPSLRLYLGYAGWTAGQLELEIQAGAWQVLPGRADWIFQTPPHDIWKRAMAARGGFWRIVAQTGFKPSLN